jgi:hypothetical protein
MQKRYNNIKTLIISHTLFILGSADGGNWLLGQKFAPH